jgi:acyl-coenzyme A thioesterase PaaI-like protein
LTRRETLQRWIDESPFGPWYGFQVEVDDAGAVEGGERAVTVHCATDFLAPARGDIIATASLLKVGRRLIVGSVDTRSDGGTLIAVHRVTYSLP